MKGIPGFVIACAVLLAPAAHGQGANPAGANPVTPGIETGRPTEDTANVQDQIFLRQLSVGNTAEMQLGNLAEGRAAATAVQEFAKRMIADHDTAQERLQRVARDKDVPLPGELDMDHEVVRDQLQDLDGEAFDESYIRAQIVDHQRAVQLLQYQIGLGQSEDVRTFAKETLVGVMRHLELARAIHAELTGAAP